MAAHIKLACDTYVISVYNPPVKTRQHTKQMWSDLTDYASEITKKSRGSNNKGEVYFNDRLKSFRDIDIHNLYWHRIDNSLLLFSY